MIASEDGMRQVVAGSFEWRGIPGLDLGRQFCGTEVGFAAIVEDAENIGQVLFGRRLVKRDAECPLINKPEIYPLRFGQAQQFVTRLTAEVDAKCIKENARPESATKLFEACGKDFREQMQPLRNIP